MNHIDLNRAAAALGDHYTVVIRRHGGPELGAVEVRDNRHPQIDDQFQQRIGVFHPATVVVAVLMWVTERVSPQEMARDIAMGRRPELERRVEKWWAWKVRDGQLNYRIGTEHERLEDLMRSIRHAV